MQYQSLRYKRSVSQGRQTGTDVDSHRYPDSCLGLLTVIWGLQHSRFPCSFDYCNSSAVSACSSCTPLYTLTPLLSLGIEGSWRNSVLQHTRVWTVERKQRFPSLMEDQVLQRSGHQHTQRGKGILPGHGETQNTIQVFWTSRWRSHQTGESFVYSSTNILTFGVPKGGHIISSFPNNVAANFSLRRLLFCLSSPPSISAPPLSKQACLQWYYGLLRLFLYVLHLWVVIDLPT